MRYLLDSNTIIDYLGGLLSETATEKMGVIVDDEPMTSVISQMETLGFNFKSISDQNTMETFIDGCTILEIDSMIVFQTINIRKMKKIDLPDAIIAATALVYDLTLITRNSNDFAKIPNLRVINPYDL
jgi:predicted nucleic acid-binding protein